MLFLITAGSHLGQTKAAADLAASTLHGRNKIICTLIKAIYLFCFAIATDFYLHEVILSFTSLPLPLFVRSLVLLFAAPHTLSSSPACLTLLNSELWHRMEASGSAVLFWRTGWPWRSPAARTQRSQQMTRAAAESLVLRHAVLCLSRAFLTLSAASVQTCSLSVEFESVSEVKQKIFF